MYLQRMAFIHSNAVRDATEATAEYLAENDAVMRTAKFTSGLIPPSAYETRAQDSINSVYAVRFGVTRSVNFAVSSQRRKATASRK